MEDEIPDLRRAAVIRRLELRHSRKESCYLVGVINPEAELYSFQRDIGRAGGDEVQHVAIFLLRHDGAGSDFASYSVLLINEAAALHVSVLSEREVAGRATKYLLAGR